MSDMLPRPEPREPFRRALRSQLMSQAATTLVGRETAWSRVQRGLMRPALALAAVVLLLVGGAGKAAADSRPGDVAYPLKRAAEQVQLVFAIDDTTRLGILAEQADHRLAELAASIVERRPATPIAQQQYAEAIAQLTKQVDAVRGQPSVSEDRKNAAEDIVDAVHLKHSAALEQLARQQGNRGDADTQDIERAKDESEKLHASDRPARTAEPSGEPERPTPPKPAKATSPSRTPEATGTGRPTESPEPSRAPDPFRSPEPTAEGHR